MNVLLADTFIDTVSAQLAKTHAEQEFDKFRRLDDASFESDFDRMVKSLSFKKPEEDD